MATPAASAGGGGGGSTGGPLTGRRVCEIVTLEQATVVLINIGREDLPMEALQDTAKGMAPAILDAL